MREYAGKHDVMAPSRRSLIGSIHGEKIMTITLLLKWYLVQGLEVTRIYTVFEYISSQCFKQFGDAVSDAGRAGDVVH